MIVLCCDHAGFDYAQKLKAYFDKNSIKYIDMTPKSFDPNDDYPDYAIPASLEVLKNKKNVGIFLCGSGIGVNMVANRYKGIRAVNALSTEHARLARKDENANVLTLGAKLLTFKMCLKIIDTFLTSPFEGGRHLRRIKKYN